MYHTLYKITNTINNKIYIGVHKTNNSQDSYFGSGIIIKKAIIKYGKENFIKTILFTFNNSHDAYLKESQIVNSNFIKSKNTYNISIGGHGGNTGNYKSGNSGKLNPSFSGFILTPKGIYESSLDAEKDFNMNRTTILKFCKNSHTVITKSQISRNKYLYSLKENPIGKTFKELGFDFIPTNYS